MTSKTLTIRLDSEVASDIQDSMNRHNYKTFSAFMKAASLDHDILYSSYLKQRKQIQDLTQKNESLTQVINDLRSSASDLLDRSTLVDEYIYEEEQLDLYLS